MTKEIEIDVYPNPAHGIVYCKMHTAEVEGELMIYDISGRQVSSIPVTRNQQLYQTDISAYPPGLYQLVLKGEGHIYSVKKVVVY